MIVLRYYFKTTTPPCTSRLVDMFNSFSSEAAPPVRYKLKEDLLNDSFAMHSDTFGNYGQLMRTDIMPDDPEDVKEAERRRTSSMNKLSYYIQSIRTHLENHNYQKAVDVLENEMLKVDKKKPIPYIYDLLMSYSGRQGNLKETFRLYNRYKERGLRVHGGTYTSLFNACANCEDKKLALSIANKVREYCNADTKHEVNVTNYNAMLKAYGRIGDFSTSLSILDEVLEKRGRIKDDTYNFLLQGCITDKNSGLRHAFLVWHKMLQNKTAPSIYSFNLMLRAVRDCSLGPPELFNNVVEKIISEGRTRSMRKSKLQFIETKLLTDGTVLAVPMRKQLSDGGTAVADLQLMNLMSLKPLIGPVLQVNAITTREHRLMLLGGANGVLQSMKDFGLVPDVKTLTLLLECSTSSLEAEQELVALADSFNVPLDVGFFNVLIKRRCFRYEYEAAKDVLALIQSRRLRADLITFGVLAMSCQTQSEGMDLIQSIRDSGFRLNSEILGALLSNACYHRDFKYVGAILKAGKEDEIQPNAKFVVKLGDFVKNEKRLLALNENTKIES